MTIDVCEILQSISSNSSCPQVATNYSCLDNLSISQDILYWEYNEQRRSAQLQNWIWLDGVLVEKGHPPQRIYVSVQEWSMFVILDVYVLIDVLDTVVTVVTSWVWPVLPVVRIHVVGS